MIRAEQLRQAGISDRATDYIYNTIDPDIREATINDEAFQDTINSIQSSPEVPEDAITINTASAESISQLENGSGQTFVIQGDLDFGQTLKLASNTTVYVDGTISRNGNYDGQGENNGDNADAIFSVDGSDDVNIIGTNKAKLVGNLQTSGVYIENSDNVTVSGLDVGNVWEGIVAHFGNNNVTITNNYVHDTGKRAIWSLGSDNTRIAHNFVENAGLDGVDFDAFTENSVAYENVIVGWRRFPGFVEEGTQDTTFAKNLAIMAEFEYKNIFDPADDTFTIGFGDNGSVDVDDLNSENYFIGNNSFKPSNYDRDASGGGDYFARRGIGKGRTYFWGNGGNVGFDRDDDSNVPDSENQFKDRWFNAEFAPTVEPGQDRLDEFETLFPTSSSGFISQSASAERVEFSTPESEDNVDNANSTDSSIRINAGGDDFTDSDGNIWQADKYFENGTTDRTVTGIEQTENDSLLQTYRYDENLQYSIPIENGSYRVNLQFSENDFTQAEQRLFDVVAEGESSLEDLDIYRSAGSNNTLLEESFDVTVQDGTLNLDFVAGVNNGIVSGIEILEL